MKAASRSGKPVEGAEGVAFDILKPDFNTLFDGVDRIFLMLPSGYSDSKGLLTPIVEAAAARNVKIVLQTAYGVNADDSIPYRQVELAVEKAGVPFVILRPNWFADNFQTFWKYGVTHGQISTPAANGKSAFIDVRDIAASAAEALTSSRFDGKAFDLTGPAALTYAEAAETLSGVLGKKITYQHIGARGLHRHADGRGRSGRLRGVCHRDLPSRPGRVECGRHRSREASHGPRAACAPRLCRTQQGSAACLSGAERWIKPPSSPCPGFDPGILFPPTKEDGRVKARPCFEA